MNQHPPAVPRPIRRYPNRKLYDAAASRYISLPELASLIREGEEVEVLDTKSGEDVTVPVLTQVISELGRRGSLFPPGLLHELIRAGEEALQAGEGALAAGVRHFQQNVEELVERLRQPSAVQEEMARLHERLEALEASLEDFTRRNDSDS